MKIIYTGPTAKGRRIPIGESSIHAPKGVAVEVPDTIAESLLGPDWIRAEKIETKAAKKAGKGDE